MNKAFIFDMDGVLINSEAAWGPFETPMLKRLLGDDIAADIADTVGLGIEGVHKRAQSLGSPVTYQDVASGYENVAGDVYSHSIITPGVEALAEKLIDLGFRLGIVTQSPQTWIDRVVPRLSFREKLDVIVSLAERTDLQGKPAPDGYLEAFKVLDTDPKASFVLEDSNFGITAGKASGAFTIGFSGNLIEGYQQTGADAYADTMEEVADIVGKVASKS